MDTQEFNLGYYLMLLWRGKWLILLVTAVAIAGGIAFSNLRSEAPSVFEASATLRVAPVVVPVGVSDPTQLSSAERGLNTQILLLQSRNVMERSLRKLSDSIDDASPTAVALAVEQLRTAITVRAIPNSDLLEVTATGNSPAQSEKRANAVVESFVEYVKEERTRAIEEALADLNRQIGTENSQEQLDELILAVMPEFERELGDISRSMDESLGILDQLQANAVSDSSNPAISVEIHSLNQVALELESFSRDLQAFEVRLGGGEQLAATGGNSSLVLEISPVRGAIADLNGVFGELQDIRSESTLLLPTSTNENIMEQIEEIRAALRSASTVLRSVQSDTTEMTRQVNSIRAYIDTVATDLLAMTTLIEALPSGGSGIPEKESTALRVQTAGLAQGLNVIVEDLSDIRTEIDAREYGRILSATGHVEKASTDLTGLSAELGELAARNSLFDDISEVMIWTRDASLSLENVIDNSLNLEVERSSQAELEAAIRASGEMDRVALTLSIGSIRLQELSASISDSLLKGRISASGVRLTTVQGNATESSSRIRAIAQLEGTIVSDRIRVLRERVQTGIVDLRAVVEVLDGNNPTPGNLSKEEPYSQAYADVSRVAWSLDVALRQLQGLLLLSSNPLLESEVNSLEQRLSAAQEDLLATSQRLSDTGDAGEVKIILIENNLNTASESLGAALGTYQGALLRGDGIYAEDVEEIKDSIDVVAAILGRVGEDLVEIQLSETNSLRFGQLELMMGRVSDAQLKSGIAFSRIQSLLGSSTTEEAELRQELELALLRPQETGITKVDSALTTQQSGGGSLLSKAGIPLATMAGLLLGSLGVVFRERMSPAVRSEGQLRGGLGLTSLGVIPKGNISGDSNIPMAASGDQPIFSEALQLVGARLSRQIADGVNSFLITSANPGEGKTMLAVNLAQVLAGNGKRVLLVDGNLRKPEVAGVLDLPNDNGLSSALAQQVSPLDYILETEGFYVLPGGPPSDNPVQLLSTPAMAFFLQQAQRGYDVVLVDGPPTLGFAEVNVQSRDINASILVIRAGATRVDAVEEAKKRLDTAGISVVASVLNFAPADECRDLHHERYAAGPRSAKRSRRPKILKVG